MLLLDPDGGRECGLSPENINGALECFHGAEHTTVVVQREHLLFALNKSCCETPHMSLGGRIVDARKARGLEQKDICDRVEGLTQQALSNLERRDSATSDYAIRIADALSVSVRWLLDGVGTMDDAEWPFPMVRRDRWERLDSEGRLFVQRTINVALAECEHLDSARAAGGHAAHVLHEPPPQPPRPAGPAPAATNVTTLNPQPGGSRLTKTKAQQERARQQAKKRER